MSFKQIGVLYGETAKLQHFFQRWRISLVAATWRLNDSYDDRIDDMIVRMYDQQRLEPNECHVLRELDNLREASVDVTS